MGAASSSSSSTSSSNAASAVQQAKNNDKIFNKQEDDIIIKQNNIRNLNDYKTSHKQDRNYISDSAARNAKFGNEMIAKKSVLSNKKLIILTKHPNGITNHQNYGQIYIIINNLILLVAQSIKK